MPFEIDKIPVSIKLKLDGDFLDHTAPLYPGAEPFTIGISVGLHDHIKRIMKNAGSSLKIKPTEVLRKLKAGETITFQQKLP